MADPIFVVKFERGLADRHRLPLSHVLSVLEEVRQMIASVGKDIQKRSGVQNASGDFGLEVLAGRDGLVFRKGSIQAQIAITRDIANGLMAADSVLNTVQKLSRAGASQSASVRFTDPLEHKIVRHLDRIAKIQQPDKTETRFTMKRPQQQDFPKRPLRSSAVLGEAAVKTIRATLTPAFSTDNLTLYGRLFELKDRNQEQDSNKFWGELRIDSGEKWRVQFSADLEAKASSLFRKQVRIDGRAFYYEAHTPKIVVKSIDADENRDYEAAFDELFGASKEHFNASFEQLLREMHGE
ncbi:MAG: hypothetical protein ABI972_17790 [Acidobacteriota bacterium]